MKICVGSWR